VETASVATPAGFDRLPTVLVAVAIVSLPILQPTGPGHFTPSDVLIAIAVIGFLLWAGTKRIEVHIPYAVPMAILGLTGLLAALFGIAPGAGFVAVTQDVFLLLWAAAIANLGRNPRNLRVMLEVWAWSAAAWGSILALLTIAHVHGATRGQLTFDNPNQAGNFFLLSFLVVLLGRRPLNPVARVCVMIAILGAILFTGSNAALVSLALGGAGGALFAIWRKTDLLFTVGVSALTVAVLAGATSYAIESGLLNRIENSSNVFIKHSVARAPKSAGGRETLFKEELGLYRTGSLIGRGPATTKLTLASSFGQVVKEAHDDYLATLIERGPLAVVGLLILIAGVFVRALSLTLRPPPYPQLLSRPSIAISIVIALLVTAVTHEILHYRHVWALLGILAALYLCEREAAAGRASGVA